MLLGLFWGVSPSFYKYLADIHMPVLHTIFYTGFLVGIIMLSVALKRSGLRGIDPRLIAYGLGCAILLNIPFGINLLMAGHVPPTELSIVITTSPFFGYIAAVILGHEIVTPRKLLAIAFGFTSTVTLILSRQGTLSGHVSWPLIASFSIPILYCGYNIFTSRAWPKGADTIQAGAFESLWSGVLALPLLFWFKPFGAAGDPNLAQHWVLIVVSLMWVMERVVYFTLITQRGAVYTIQATYVSTPAAVIISALFFGGGTDTWLWVSLAILMVAIYLNNSGSASELKIA
jgi:drug/metabolite transporter (DMT)-like permease